MRLKVSPITFPFRQVGGPRAWTLFKTMDHGSNKLVSVVVKNVHIKGNPSPLLILSPEA